MTRWLRTITRFGRTVESEPPSDPFSGESLDVDAAVRLLPTLLDGSSLPNGVVELVVDDFEAPTRQLFDVNNGQLALVEPGAIIPWASISGSPTAWAMALGPERDLSELRLTGDERLARCVLVAIPQSSHACA